MLQGILFMFKVLIPLVSTPLQVITSSDHFGTQHPER